MQRRRRNLLAILVMLSAALLPACGKEKTEGRKTVVFSFGELSERHGAALATLTERFEAANPGLRVVLHELEPATDLQRHFYHQSFTARSAFIDVFEMDNIWTGELAAAGVLLPPAGAALEGLSHVEPQSLEGARYDGKLVAVPAFPAVSLLFYRKDLLEKHALPVPTTWSQLATTAGTIAKAEGIDGFVWQGAAYEGLVCNFLEYYRSHGGVIRVLEQGVELDGKLVKAALKTMKGFLSEGISPAAVTEYTEVRSRARFLAGEAVFARDWDDLAGFVEAPGSEVAGKVGIALLPGTSLHRGVPTLGGWHLAVNWKTLVPEEAWRFVAFLTSRESQEFLAAELGRLPADTRIPLPGRKGLEGIEHVRTALAQSQPRPRSPYYHELSLLLQAEIHGVLAGSRSLDDGVTAIVDGARKIELPVRSGPEFPRALLNPSTVF